MKQELFQEIIEKLQAGMPANLYLEAGERQAVRSFVPSERLILLGGGHIALPLCRIGAMLDFAVTVVDDRPSFAAKSRFPEAVQVICDDFAHAIRTLQLRETDYVCIITRGHKHDADCLREILPGVMPHYIGMIGSHRRVSGLFELLREEGYDADRIAQVNAPIGLKINAMTTTEIAISIAAQLIEYRRRKPEGIQAEEVLAQTNTDMPLLAAIVRGEQPMVLAVVLNTKGSTPVKSGAMMTVGILGRIEGTAGGGCGEAEIIRIARGMVGTGERRIVHVDMTNDAAEEEGMVCGGVMEVLLECIE